VYVIDDLRSDVSFGIRSAMKAPVVTMLRR
jgi:hypothetical protein